MTRNVFFVVYDGGVRASIHAQVVAKRPNRGEVISSLDQ
jgi:hypothetical protein